MDIAAQRGSDWLLSLAALYGTGRTL